jgi:arylformamidase
MKLFDVTRPIHDGMVVYEGDPLVVVRRIASVTAGACANVSEVHLGSHTGTHVDPPLHFREGGPGVDELPLDILIGPARVHELAVRGQIDAVGLRGVDLTACPRVLFKTCTADSRGAHGYPAACAGLTAEAARALVGSGVRLVGLDGASVDPPGAVGFPAHRTLLDAGVIVLEGLDLSAVPPGDYELLCLPLKILGGDGAPARVVLRSLD